MGTVKYGYQTIVPFCRWVRSSKVINSMFTVRRNMATGGEGVNLWYQREVTIPAKKRGCHYITDNILTACKEELNQIKIGTANIHIKHTSASIILNENYDPTVLVSFQQPFPSSVENYKTDMEMVLNKLAPENLNYKHTMEGPDDMPAHVKAALMGSSVCVPITNGKFNLGTWQGVWLCEHRDHGGFVHVGLAKDCPGFVHVGLASDLLLLESMTVKLSGCNPERGNTTHKISSRKLVVTINGLKK